MSRQYWQELIWWATADGASINTTAAETIIFPDVTIPANYMADGRVLRVQASGRWSNVVTAVPTLTFALRWGGVAGTLLATSPAIVTPATATGPATWDLNIRLQTRANGATGSLFAMGTLAMFEDAAATAGTVANYGIVQPISAGGAGAPAAVTADLTTDKALSLTAKWSASNAANIVVGHIYLGESLN